MHHQALPDSLSYERNGLAVAVVLFKKGASAFAQPSYTLEATRGALKDTKSWVTNPRG